MYNTYIQVTSIIKKKKPIGSQSPVFFIIHCLRNIMYLHVNIKKNDTMYNDETFLVICLQLGYAFCINLEIFDLRVVSWLIVSCHALLYHILYL